MLNLNHELKFYKFIQSKSNNIPQTDKFEDLPAKLEFEIAKKTQLVLAFFTMTVASEKMVAARLKSDLGDIPSSLAVQAPTMFAGLFNWAVQSFEKGAHMIWM